MRYQALPGNEYNHLGLLYCLNFYIPCGLQVGIVDMSAINANKLFTIRTIFIKVVALTASFAGLLLFNLIKPLS